MTGGRGGRRGVVMIIEGIYRQLYIVVLRNDNIILFVYITTIYNK